MKTYEKPVWRDGRPETFFPRGACLTFFAYLSITGFPRMWYRLDLGSVSCTITSMMRFKQRDLRQGNSPQAVVLIRQESLAERLHICQASQDTLSSFEIMNVKCIQVGVSQIWQSKQQSGVAHDSQRSVEPSTSDTTMVISLSTRPSPFPAPTGSVPGGLLHAKVAFQDVSADMRVMILEFSQLVTGCKR